MRRVIYKDDGRGRVKHPPSGGSTPLLLGERKTGRGGRPVGLAGSLLDSVELMVGVLACRIGMAAAGESRLVGFSRGFGCGGRLSRFGRGS